MAIVKTIFSTSNCVANSMALQSWLQTNAGNLFESIEPVKDSYNQHGVVLKRNDGGNGSRDVIRLRTDQELLIVYNWASGEFVKTQTGDYNAGTMAFKAGYATSKGVMFTRVDPRMGSYYIAQDSSGDTIVCGCTYNGRWGDTIPDWQYFVYNATSCRSYLHGAVSSPSSSATYAQCVSYNVSEAAATSLAPVVQAQSDALVDGLYFVPFADCLGTVGIIELGGKKYVYNGIFALEE